MKHAQYVLFSPDQLCPFHQKSGTEGGLAQENGPVPAVVSVVGDAVGVSITVSSY